MTRKKKELVATTPSLTTSPLTRQRGWISGGLAVVAVVAALWFVMEADQVPPNAYAAAFHLTGKVPWRLWPAAGAKAIDQEHKLVVFKKTPAEAWQARHWTEHSLRQRLGRLHRVQHLARRELLYIDSTKHLKSDGADAVEERDLDAGDFFDKLSRQSLENCTSAVCPRLYYSRAVGDNDLATLLPDLRPGRPFVLHEHNARDPTYNTSVNTQVWIGGSGSAAHAHYDIFSNFYVQLIGRKRFVVAYPQEHRALYLYPFIHQHARQAQIPTMSALDESRHADFPLYGTAKAMTVDLQPGDVLYLPPFTFHQVEALDALSVSINVWSNSHEADAMVLLKQAGLPDGLELKTTSRVRSQTLATYIRALVDTIWHETAPKQGPTLDANTVVRELIIDTRYRPLFASLPSCADFKAARCPRAPEPLNPAITRSIDACAARAVRVVAQLFTETVVHSQTPDRTHAVAFFRATRDILIANYIEELVAVTLGATHVCPFLRCLVDGAW